MVQESLSSTESAANEAFDAHCIECLQGMAACDEKAMNDFYEATLSKVYGVAIRILGDTATAEEVVADVYYEAWCNASSYDRARGRPITWLLTICRSRSIDEYRRESAAARKLQAAASADSKQTENDPDQLLQAVEEGHAVQALLAAITPKDRQLLALAFFKGFNHQQIAEFTGTPLGTVKSRIRRALQSLNESLPAELLEQ